MRTARSRVAIALLAGTALVAACGDDDGSLFGGDDDGDETASTDTDDNGGDVTVPESAATDDFCTIVANLDDMDVLDDPFVDPSLLESSFTVFTGMASAALEQAPEEVADDIAVVVGALERFRDGLEAADYNILDVQLSVFIDIGNDPDLEAASDRLDGYGEQECGIPSDGDSEPFDDGAFDDLPEGATTMREAIVLGLIDEGLDEDSAQCIGDALEPTDLSDDGSQLAARAEQCGIDPATGQPLED